MNENDFESELRWCLEKLQRSIDSKSRRQAEETLRAIKILENPKTTMIRKRQVMRNTLGDYRNKMAQEEKTFKLNAVIRDQCKTESSKFLKKCVATKDSFKTENSFKFNFKIPEEKKQ